MSEPHRRTNRSPPAIRTDGGRDERSADDETPDGETPDDATFEATDERHGAEPTDDERDTAPLGDLARRLGGQDGRTERTEGESDGDVPDEFDEISGDDAVVSGDADELFEEMDVSDVDPDVIWDSVLNGDETEPVDATPQQLSESEPTENGQSVDVDEQNEDEDEATETLVPKGTYCESCYFFSDPPEATCTYSGSEIVEIVDSDQFKVRNCPVVAGFVDTDGTAATDDNGLSAGSGSSD